MRNRWGSLAMLFVVRLGMAFQFQSVAAVAPLLGSQFGANLADIGFLIGVYFTPGIVLALPGGAIGNKLGDRRAALLALALMLLGTLLMAEAATWRLQIAGRFLAGAGSVVLNVQLTKMVTDWFAGHEIATAMAIFVTSWPAGIALALLLLPVIGTRFGLQAAFLTVAALIGLGLVLTTTYRPPAETPTAASSSRLRPWTMLAVTVAGLIWGLFNVGFATVISFGPTLFVERGRSITSAGSLTSLALWFSLLSVPLGGFIADRFRRPQTVLVCGCLLSAALMVAMAHVDAAIPILVGLGLITGLPAGPMMSLPARVLAPSTRAIGMGLFYLIYYGAMMLGSILAGLAAKSAGSASAAIDFGGLVVLACLFLLWAFNRIADAAPANK